jgi:hypothetical protein
MRISYDSQRYFEEKAKLPKPDGKHCIICGKELPKKKRKYCSPKCFLDWYKKIGVLDWSVFRWQAFERDNFTCKKCGTYKPPIYTTYKNKQYIQDMPELECDHIIPIFLGGAEFDLSNLQTLCRKCHKIKTREEARLWTKMEREIRTNGQTRLLDVSKEQTQ